MFQHDKPRSAAFALLTFALLAGCSRKPEEIKIGALVSLSGMAKTDGEQARRAMELAIDELNAGELKATPVRLVEGNSDSDPARAAAELQRLIRDEKVAAVVAAVSSDEVLACAPAANLSKTVLYATTASSDDIRQSGDFVFRSMGSAAAEATVLVRRIAELFPGGKVVVLHSDRAFGVSYRDSFVNALAGKKPVPSTISYPSGSLSFAPQIAALRAAAPAAILLAGNDSEIAAILKEARAAGITAPFFAAGIISDLIPAQGGPAAEGLVVVAPAFDADSTVEKTRAFVAAFRKRYGVEPTYSAANSYDAVWLLARLIQKGAKTGEALRDGLYTKTDFPSLSGPLTFDPDGEVSLPPRLLEVRGGKYQSVR
jgi:branched-chain amino acid transport system substrate-binding protein